MTDLLWLVPLLAIAGAVAVMVGADSWPNKWARPLYIGGIAMCLSMCVLMLIVMFGTTA